MLDAIADALDLQVLPVTDDKWAASTVRSAVQLLRYLSLRVVQEPALLPQQLAQLRTALQKIDAMLTSPQLADLRGGVRAALRRPAPPAHDMPALDAEIDILLRAAESVIAARQRVQDASGSSAIHDALLGCLTRQLSAERELILPFQSTPPI
jgi:hypothetical protein